MINRDIQDVILLTYNQTKDDYGQIRQDTPTQTTIQMSVYDYKHQTSESMLFAKVELIGLTKASITDANEVIINSITYCIAKVINNKRYNQIFLYRVA